MKQPMKNVVNKLLQESLSTNKTQGTFTATGEDAVKKMQKLSKTSTDKLYFITDITTYYDIDEPAAIHQTYWLSKGKFYKLSSLLGDPKRDLAKKPVNPDKQFPRQNSRSAWRGILYTT